MAPRGRGRVEERAVELAENESLVLRQGEGKTMAKGMGGGRGALIEPQATLWGLLGN